MLVFSKLNSWLLGVFKQKEIFCPKCLSEAFEDKFKKGKAHDSSEMKLVKTYAKELAIDLFVCPKCKKRYFPAYTNTINEWSILYETGILDYPPRKTNEIILLEINL